MITDNFGVLCILLYSKFWHLTGTNIFSSSIALNSFKPKERLQGCFLFDSCPTTFCSYSIVCFDTIFVSLKCNNKGTYKSCPALDKFPKTKHPGYTLNTVTKTLAFSQSKWWGVQNGCQVLCMLAAPDLMDSERRYFKTMIWLKY